MYFPYLFQKMAIIISHSNVVHAAFASSLACQTFDGMILGRLSFPGTRCFKVVRGENTGPTNGTKSEKVWEPGLNSLACLSIESKISRSLNKDKILKDC